MAYALRFRHVAWPIVVAAACCGCTMCQDCTDFSPPVIGSLNPNGSSGGRVGSNLTGVAQASALEAEDVVAAKPMISESDSQATAPTSDFDR